MPIEYSQLIGMVTPDLGLISSNAETPSPGSERLQDASNYLQECCGILEILI